MVPSVRRAALTVVALLAGIVGGACDPAFPSSEGEAPIDRDAFVETYVDLRLEAARWDGGRLPDSARVRVLDEHDVDEEELREFIRVHGRNVPLMSGIWAEVNERIQEEADRMQRERDREGDEDEDARADEDRPADPPAGR